MRPLETNQEYDSNVVDPGYEWQCPDFFYPAGYKIAHPAGYPDVKYQGRINGRRISGPSLVHNQKLIWPLPSLPLAKNIISAL